MFRDYINKNDYYSSHDDFRVNDNGEIWKKLDHASYRLTYEGIKILAYLANQKYFKGKNRALIIPVNRKDFINQFLNCIRNPACVMAGFTFMLEANATDRHPTPLILEKKNGALHIFISDSMRADKDVYNELTKILDENHLKANFYLPVYNALPSDDKPQFRQASDNLCHSDAFFYNQRALRFNSLLDEVKLVPRKRRCSIKIFL